MEFPDDLRYTKDHEWVRKEGDTYAVGITEYATEQLGDITYVELPEIGMDLVKGASAGTVESVKAASDVFAPITGRVAEINEELETRPELVNESPYNLGWFFVLEDIKKSQFKELMDAAAYEEFIKELDA